MFHTTTHAAGVGRLLKRALTSIAFGQKGITMTQEMATGLFAKFVDVDGSRFVLTKASIRGVHEFNDEVTRVIYVVGQQCCEVKVRGSADEILKEAGFTTQLDVVPDLIGSMTKLRAINQENTVFVVAFHDDHADSDYYVFFDKDEAIKKARECVDESKQRYEGMNSYPTQCDGRYGIWFSESGEDRWKVQVHEARIQ